MLEALETFADNFDCRDINHSSNFKNLTPTTKKHIHKAAVLFTGILETAAEELRREAVTLLRNYNK